MKVLEGDNLRLSEVTWSVCSDRFTGDSALPRLGTRSPSVLAPGSLPMCRSASPSLRDRIREECRPGTSRSGRLVVLPCLCETSMLGAIRSKSVVARPSIDRDTRLLIYSLEGNGSPGPSNVCCNLSLTASVGGPVVHFVASGARVSDRLDLCFSGHKLCDTRLRSSEIRGRNDIDLRPVAGTKSALRCLPRTHVHGVGIFC